MQTNREIHRRKMFAGMAMIGAPLLLAAAYLVGPSTKNDATEQMRELVAASGRVEIGMILYLAALVLFVFVTFALAHLLREERPWLSQIAIVLGVTGLMMTGAMNGAYLVLTEAAEIDIASAAALMESLETNPVAIVLFAGMIGFVVGFVLLAVGLLRARTAPTWSAILLGVGVVTESAGTFAASEPIALLGVGAMFVGLATLGYELIVESDEAWEHPAQFEGFQPVIGVR